MTINFDVIIVGAGLAGLRAASVLEAHGLLVLVLEQREKVGGRMSSHRVDGFVIDEGFQLINPAYPELVSMGILESFDLRRFEPSVRFVDGENSTTIVDPRQSPRGSLTFLQSRHVSFSDTARAIRLFVQCGLGSSRSILRQRDTSTLNGLKRHGFTSTMIEGIWRPFLSGTLLEDDLETSWIYTQLLLRSFFRGRPGTHPDGIGALPETMARRLGTTSIRLGEGVRKLKGTSVLTTEGEYKARAVIVATDAADANRFVSGDDVPWLGQTTWWFALPRSNGRTSLQIDVRAHPFTSALDLTLAAPERAPSGSVLVAVPANGASSAKGYDRAAAEYVARMFDTALEDVSLVERSVVPRALPQLIGPLRLSRNQVRGDVVVAGDYLQTPSIQGALVSGRRAAQHVLTLLRV